MMRPKKPAVLVLLLLSILVSSVCSGGEIHTAAAKGDLERVKALLDQNPRLVNERGRAEPREGEAPPPDLLSSIMAWMNFVELSGEGIISADQSGMPLHFAVARRHTDVMRFLIEKGADVDARSGDGSSALFLAMENGDSNIARLLLENGAEHSVLTAAGLGDMEALKAILKETPRGIRIMDWQGKSALHWASSRGHLEACRTLLQAGLPVDIRDRRGRTPLHKAAISGHEAVAALLLDKAADPNVGYVHGDTPLHDAAMGGHVHVCRLLLERGADPDGGRATKPLYRAAEDGDTELVKMLLEAGADPNARRDETPLHVAARRGHIGAMRLLIEAGAEVNPRDRHRQTPLHEAAARGQAEAAELLLEHGAEPQARDDRRRTPAQIAYSRGHEQLARRLSPAARVD